MEDLEEKSNEIISSRPRAGWILAKMLYLCSRLFSWREKVNPPHFSKCTTRWGC